MFEVLTKEQTNTSRWRESSFFPYNWIFDTDSEPEPDNKPKPNISTANISKSATEVKLNLPKVFSGKRTELNKFLQDVLVYLTVNKEVYNNDEKKIMYLLSFMTEGDAALWKEEFLAWKIKEAEKNNTDLKLGTFKEVKEMIKKLFEPFDGPGDALEEMKCLKMANNSNIDKHVAKFKILVTWSGLSDSTAIMDFFREILPTPLQKQVMTCKNPPTTLKEWYEKVTKFHSNWQKKEWTGSINKPNKIKIPIPNKEGMRSECHGCRLHDNQWTSRSNEERSLLQMQKDWTPKGSMSW